MGFLDQLGDVAKSIGKSAGDFAKQVGDKTNDALEINKLNTKISAENAEIEKEKKKLSDALFERFSRGEDIPQEVKEFCENIKSHLINIDGFKEEIEKGRSYKDFAILYRVNAVSRVFEEILRQEMIPHKVIGGFKFYERKEIKDVLAYLKLIINPNDNIAFSRIINEPKRGIGQTSIDKMVAISMETGLPLLEIVRRAGEFGLRKSRT